VGRTYDVSMRAYKDPDGFMAGKFDAEVDELWDEWGTVSKMARPIQLPAGQMIFTWMERGRQNEHAERYSPTGTWQTFRGAVPVPQAVDVVLDPYQTPCQIWIRKAVWHTGNSERRAILGPGPNGALDDLFGMKRLTIFGPHALMVQGAPGAGPIEFEMEFKVITGQAVLNDLVNMLRARLEQTRRATASPYGMGRRK
jgi:hypothetical protein